MADRIECYLAELRAALEVSVPLAERIVAEAEDHLREGASWEADRGLSIEEAEREVIERFGPPEVVARWWNEIYQRQYGGGKMWQRFTERARRVVFFAQEEAARLGENHVGTEHLLLGLVRETDHVAARILQGDLGVSLTSVRQETEKQVAHGPGNLGQDMQLTPRAKRMIDLAYEEARNLSNNYIGTEHLLLGLIREEEDRAQVEQAGAARGEGLLEILPQGWGFLRRREDLAPSPDDIYVSKSQIERFTLKAGDRVSGRVRPPVEGETQYGLLRIETRNHESVEPGNFDDRGGAVLVRLGATLDRTRSAVQSMQEVENTLIQRVKEQFLQAVERGTALSPEMRALMSVLTLHNPAQLADAIAPYLALRPLDEQALQSAKANRDRLEKVSELLASRKINLETPSEQKPGEGETPREIAPEPHPASQTGERGSAPDAQIARVAETILQQAVKDRAAAIQIDLIKNFVMVRYQIDGTLQDRMKLPHHIHPRLLEHFKRAAGLDPEEHSLAQLGLMSLAHQGHDYAFEVQIEPTSKGEKLLISLPARE